MKIIGIETATRLGGVALMDDEAGLLGEIRFNTSLSHSETLVGRIDLLLKAAGITLDDIGAFAVSAGPGSFTGLRVGLGTAKGLSFPTGIPIIPVSSLEALAAPLALGSLPVCPMISTRRTEVYSAVYRPKDGELIEMLPEDGRKPEDLIDAITEPTIFVTDPNTGYFPPLRELFIERIPRYVRFAQAPLAAASGAWVAELGLRALKRGYRPTEDVRPRYLKPCEAELKLSTSK